MISHRKILGASFAACLAFGGTAYAHPRLISTTPAANSTAQRPNKVQLKFSERLIARMTAADLTMAGVPGHAPVRMDGFTQSIGADGKTVTLARTQPLSAGKYRVNWHAVSVDTHRVAGTFGFAVK